MHTIIDFIVSTVANWGYFGIFVMMFLESSFFPFPSEVAIIPAGFLASKGEMNILIILLSGTAGSLIGAIFNYYLCFFYGRDLIIKYGRFFGLNKNSMQKFESFFIRHGEISIFTSRLIPGIRQYISLPAGLFKMNFLKFSIYTTLGAAIWVFILICVGYFLGNNQDLISKELTKITLILVFLVIFILLIYIKIKKNS